MNEPHFQGHFPGKPIMPGELVLEAMAQTAGILGFMSVEEEHAGESYYFVGSERLRLRRQVLPGDQLRLEAQIHSVRQNLWKFDCQARVADQEVCSTLITCARRGNRA